LAENLAKDRAVDCLPLGAGRSNVCRSSAQRLKGLGAPRTDVAAVLHGVFVDLTRDICQRWVVRLKTGVVPTTAGKVVNGKWPSIDNQSRRDAPGILRKESILVITEVALGDVVERQNSTARNASFNQSLCTSLGDCVQRKSELLKCNCNSKFAEAEFHYLETHLY
jgi:hypothetical protein